MTFAEAISRARARGGMSQVKFAAAMGTQQSSVSRIESGRHDIKESTVRLVAKTLGISVSELLRDC